eukprot:gene3009-5892_t
MEIRQSIKIPFGEEKSNYVEVFPDEIPSDVNDLIDVLRAEFAPIKIWKDTADSILRQVEYYRQGLHKEFHLVLNEIITVLNDDPDSEVAQTYKQKPEFKESILEIYNVLAADALVNNPDKNQDNKDAYSKIVLEYLNKADEVTLNSNNDYTNLIKAFFELRLGNLDRAKYYLSNLYLHASRNTDGKKAFLYITHVGLGALAYARKKSQAALEHFSDAMKCNPSCDAAVLVAAAGCLFELGQYEKSRALLNQVITLDAGNVNALVLLSLMDRVIAQKDKTRRKECRESAHEYSLLAAQMDPSCALALNHMANYFFHTWKFLDDNVEIMDAITLRFKWPSSSASLDNMTLQEGDLLQLNHSYITSVKKIDKESHPDRYILVTVKVDLPPALLALATTKEFHQTKLLAGKAFRVSTVAEIKSESCFILGRVYHDLGETNYASHLYKEALKYWPDMSLAAMLLGQLLFAENKYVEAKELFQKVLSRHPEDKDAQAYLYLVKGLNQGETTSMDKLKEVAAGFAWEEDLWLLQGQLRLSDSSEHGAALKCLESAMECILRRGGDLDPSHLSNIAVLHHTLGTGLHIALDYSRKALLAVEKAAAATAAASISVSASSTSSDEPVTANSVIFRCTDNDVFYTWSDELFKVTVTDNTEFGNVTLSMVTTTPSDSEKKVDGGARGIKDFLQEDDDVLIGDVIFTVQSLAEDGSSFTAKGFVKLKDDHDANGNENGDGDGGQLPFPVRRKIPARNFTAKTITLCFNLARVLEDTGRSRAAAEIYVQLLDKHPSYIECYLRLAKISGDLGRLQDALVWTKRALAVDESNVDALVCLGDLMTLRNEPTDALKIYEKAIKQVHHDQRCMLSMGNANYLIFSTNYASDLRDSCKFFSSGLGAESKNAYMANGLAIACVEKKFLDLAKETFTKIRDLNACPAVEVLINLGNTNLIQRKYGEAILMFQSALKTLTQPCGTNQHNAFQQPARRFAYVYECLALAHLRHGQHADANRSILRCVRMDPSSSSSWYNHAALREEMAVNILQKPQRLPKEIEVSINELETARRMFKCLTGLPSTPSLLLGSMPVLKYESENAISHEVFCTGNISKAKTLLLRATEEDQLRKTLQLKQQERHQEERRLKKLLEEEQLESERRLRQEKAQQKALQLEALQNTWKSIPSSSSQSQTPGRGGKGKRKGQDVRDADGGGGGDGDQYSDLDFGSDDSEVEGEASTPPPRPAAAAGVGKESRPTSADTENLFGSDSEKDDDDKEEEVVLDGGSMNNTATSPAPATNTSDASSDVRSGGRLKRPLGGNVASSESAEAEKDEEEMNFETNDNVVSPTAPIASGEDSRPTKQRRVIDEDDDDE